MAAVLPIGIDVGTRSSRVGVIADGVAWVAPSPEGNTPIPSLVAFDDEGTVVVGEMAARRAWTDPGGTAAGFTRLLGRRFGEPVVEAEQRRRIHLVEPGPDGEARLVLGRRELTAEMATALLLFQMKTIAEARIGASVYEAVLTAPYRWGVDQRRALHVAAWMAGLEVRGLIDPATAAVLPYALGHPEAGVVAVVDIGAGSVDVGLYRVVGGDVRVLARDGDPDLGGDALDFALARQLEDRFRAETGIDLQRHPLAQHRLREAVRAAKHRVSVRCAAPIHERALVGSSNGPLDLEATLSRAELEAALEPLEAPLLAPVHRALADAELDPRDVQTLLLCGGQARTPALAEALGLVFPMADVPTIEAGGWAACGAVVEALLLEAGPSPRSDARFPPGFLPPSPEWVRGAETVRQWWAEASGRPPGLASVEPMPRELIEDLSSLMRATSRR